MWRTNRRPAAWAALAALVALVAANGVLAAPSRTLGPLAGILLYSALIWRWLRRDYQAGIVGGGAGLVIHIIEVVGGGWTALPLLMALNLVLPALLGLMSWLAIREME